MLISPIHSVNERIQISEIVNPNRNEFLFNRETSYIGCCERVGSMDTVYFVNSGRADRRNFELLTRGFAYFAHHFQKAWLPNHINFSGLKDYFSSDWWRSRVGSWLDLRTILLKSGSKIRKSPSRFLIRKNGVAGAILRARS